jgi:NitT/TauT family transport system permease protein
VGLSNVRVKLLRPVSLADALVLFVLVALVFGLVGVAQVWTSPFRPTTQIELTPTSLVGYSLLSLVRVVLAYLCSLAFALTYGYVAAKSRRLEPLLISILDILQSVPVLGFMPGLVLTLVHIFPSSNIGLELAAILMIFSGQAWNMVFSFYSSLKAVPDEWKDMTALLRLTPFQVLRSVELPFAANGLLWNSMLSVAGGWFFLMTIESFSLGDRSFRLPGIGSFMAVAHEQRNYGAIVAGIISMFLLIIVVDRCLWAPLVVWSDRFKFQAKREETAPRSFVLDLLMKSDLLSKYFELVERTQVRLSQRRDEILRLEKAPAPVRFVARVTPSWKTTLRYGGLVLLVVTLVLGTLKMYQFVAATTVGTWTDLLLNTGLTLVRVCLAVVLGSLWAIPVGVLIGTRPKLTRRLQPVVQIVAAFPFPMLFPLFVVVMDRLGIGLGIGSVGLLMLSSQWYILFNIISGASAIPSPIMELAELFQIRGWAYWKSIIFPAIYPSLVNGWVTAAGGAWNACIVAEWVNSGDRIHQTKGIGAAITAAAGSADFAILASGITTLVVTVVLINRFLWGWLYHRAETRYKMDV